MMRWNGSEEQVTSALAILMILAALVVVGAYALEIAQKDNGGLHHTFLKASLAHR